MDPSGLRPPEAHLAGRRAGDRTVGPEQPAHRFVGEERPAVMGDGDLLAELRVLGVRIVAEQAGAAPDADQRQQRQAGRMHLRPGPDVGRVGRDRQRRDVGDVAAAGDGGALLRLRRPRRPAGLARLLGIRGRTPALAVGNRDVLTGGSLGADQAGDLVRRRPRVLAVAGRAVAHLSSCTSRYTT